MVIETNNTSTPREKSSVDPSRLQSSSNPYSSSRR